MLFNSQWIPSSSLLIVFVLLNNNVLHAFCQYNLFTYLHVITFLLCTRNFLFRSDSVSIKCQSLNIFDLPCLFQMCFRGLFLTQMCQLLKAVNLDSDYQLPSPSCLNNAFTSCRHCSQLPVCLQQKIYQPVQSITTEYSRCFCKNESCIISL